MLRFCRVEFVEGGRELWMDILQNQQDPTTIQPVKVHFKNIRQTDTFSDR